jgi:deoxyribonuclease V
MTYNRHTMPRGKSDPDWPDLIQSWKKTQLALRKKMRIEPLDPLPRFVAGADAAFSTDKQKVLAAAVVYDRIEKRIIEIAHATRPIEFPYIPTFLSFREAPTVIDAIAKLKHPWGVICLDGQGYAHPRRCGLAAHISILLDRPGVGIAKSRLIGTFKDPANSAGSSSSLMDKDEQIGLVLRTRQGVKPLFVSIGHRINLKSAAELALACVSRYRIPEPTRQADIEVAKLKVR